MNYLHQNIVKVALSTFLMGLFFLGGCKGCGQIVPPPKSKPPVLSTMTLQKVFDEAAKGQNANLPFLKKAYSELVKSKTEADELASMKDTEDDNFLCKMLKLPAMAEPLFVIDDLLQKVSDPAALINKDCAEAKKPLALLLEPSRSSTTDQKLHNNQMITTLIKKGGDTTLVSVSDKTKLEQVLEAALNDEDLLTRVLKKMAPSLKGDALRWASGRYYLAAVKTALKNAAIITNKMIVDEAKAALADPSKTPQLDFFYTIAIQGDTSGAKATALALEEPSTGGTARFSHFLAQLVPDAQLLTIWQDYLQQIKTAGGDQAVIDQSKLPGAAEIPLNYELAHPTSAERDEIVKLLTEKDIENLSKVVSPNNLPQFLTVLTEEEEANFLKGFTTVWKIPALKDAAFDWVSDNYNSRVGIKPPLKLKPGITASSARPYLHDLLNASKIITAQMVVDEAARGPGVADPKKLLNLFALYIDDQASAAALAAQPKEGTKDKFSHFLARLPASPETSKIWEVFFKKLGSEGHEDDVVAQINLGANDTPPSPTPFQEMLKQPRSFDRKAIVRLMLEKGDEATIRAVADPERVKEMLEDSLDDAQFMSGNAAFLPGKIFKTIKPELKPALYEWAKKQQEFAGVIDALRTAGFVTLTMIVDEAAKGAGKSDLDLLELFFRTEIYNHAHAVALTKTPPTSGVADRFINFLAKLPANRLTLRIWESFFTKLAEGDPADVTAQINLGATEHPPQSTPFEEMVTSTRAIAGDKPEYLAKILALMVKNGDRVTIKAIHDKASMDILLNALLKSGDERSLEKAFININNPLFDDMVGWAMEHRTKFIGDSGQKVLDAMRASDRITDWLLRNEAALSVSTNWKKVLFYTQVLAYDKTSALRVKDINFAQTLLHNIIVQKAQTPESVATLKHFLSFLEPSDWEKVRDNAAGLLKMKAADLIKAKGHPDAAKLNGPDAAPIKDALLIFETLDAKPQPNPPKALAIMDEAP